MDRAVKFIYVVVYEQTPNNYGAYVPDLPGCVSTGDSWTEIQENVREAIAFHIEGLMMDNDPVPDPRMSVGDAMAFHCDVLAESSIVAPEMETTVGLVEVDVWMQHTVLEGSV